VLFQGSTMLITEHSVQTNVTPEQIWRVWQDVESWPSWDHDLEFSRIDGPFQTGTTGCFKTKSGPVLKTVLTRVEPLKIFVQEAKLPLAKVIMTHTISELDGKTQVIIKTEVKGLLAFFYYYLIGRSIKNKVPIEVKEMLKKAEHINISE